MGTLKELTWDSHKRAEKTHIMHELLTDTISASLYCDLVYTKYLIYATIESRIKFQNSCVYRAYAAFNDWQHMRHSLPKCMECLDEYVAHLQTVPEDQLWAHVYVHYLAPLYGGQIIKKKIEHRFPVSLYEFADPTGAIAEVRGHLSADLAAEANLAFESTITYYNQLWEQHNPS
jgi:heme oxygenase